jgi:hypothetical protein
MRGISEILWAIVKTDPLQMQPKWNDRIILIQTAQGKAFQICSHNKILSHTIM